MTEATTLRRIDPEAKMHRFYRISVQPCLFGNFALIREWGRIGTAGQSMEEWFNDEADAKNAGRQLTTQKQRRGYIT